MTFFFFIALFIFIYTCAKLVFRYLRDTKMLSADAIAEIHKQENEIAARKRQTFWLGFAGLLFGVGLGIVIAFVIHAHCLAEAYDDDIADTIVGGIITLFGGAGMLGGNVLSRILGRKYN